MRHRRLLHPLDVLHVFTCPLASIADADASILYSWTWGMANDSRALRGLIATCHNDVTNGTCRSHGEMNR